MLTLALQSLVSVFDLLFGLGALWVARTSQSTWGVRQLAWRLTGIAFCLLAANGIPSKVLAAVAFFSGPGSSAMEIWMWARTIGNDGRSVMMVGFAFLLLKYARGKPEHSTTTPKLLKPLLLWMVGGSIIGIIEGPAGATHFGVISVVTAAAVVVLFAALWVAVVKDTMDYLLWIALTVYAVREVIGTSLWSVFSWLDVPGAWIPSHSSVQWAGVASHVVMLSILGWRISLAKRGIAVPSLFELDGRRSVATRLRHSDT